MSKVKNFVLPVKAVLGLCPGGSPPEDATIVQATCDGPDCLVVTVTSESFPEWDCLTPIPTEKAPEAKPEAVKADEPHTPLRSHHAR